jgi:catechol 2,3-dioxygenase-like lactoylglutathione lyase family enzyme
MNALRLLRISLTVRDLASAAQFYRDALGFGIIEQARAADPAMATLLGAGAIRVMLMQRGSQFLELAAFDPPGAEYPPRSHSNDRWFQHCALVTADIDAAYGRLNRYPHSAISRNGPQTLPDGTVAFKFRDPEGHPLELIQLPNSDAVTEEGIDHSAIVVSDADCSIAFYAGVLNMRVRARQVNRGPAQDNLDALARTQMDVVAVTLAHAVPHVELLGYRHPRGREAARMRPSDIAASRLVFAVDHLADDLEYVVLRDGTRAASMVDPDGHALLLLEAACSDTGPPSASAALTTERDKAS